MSTSRKKTTMKKEERTTGFRVVSESYPSGGGCYYGQELDDAYIRACTTTTIVGEYDTMSDAKEAAIAARDSAGQFEDWAEDHYEDKPPPYCSSDMFNPDEDEEVYIYIVDIAKELAEKENTLKKARASAPPKKTKAPTKAQQRKFGPAKGNFKPDTEIFLRNPCRLGGGESRLPNEYGNGGTGKNTLAYMVQRVSDRNYTMRSFCLDGGGAKYTSFQMQCVMSRSVAWIPSTNLNDHAENETILDACHLDLVNSKNGKCLLTADSLLAAASPEIRCMFVNGYHGDSKTPQDIVKAIEACPNLQCFSLTESVISNEVLEALEACTDLRGITICMPENKSPCATDEGLADLLRACPKLSWIFVHSDIFGEESWMALAAGACADLEVLWVNSTESKNGRMGVARGDVDVIRSVLSRRSSSLKLCMINPDDKLKSRHIRTGAKQLDRLEGTKIKMPKFEEEYCDFADFLF